VTTLVALDEAENQVTDVYGLSLDPTAVVSVQCLLVLGRVEEGDVAGLIKLIQGIFENSLASGSLYIMTLDAL
jgi:hypothetical protein